MPLSRRQSAPPDRLARRALRPVIKRPLIILITRKRRNSSDTAPAASLLGRKIGSTSRIAHGRQVRGDLVEDCRIVDGWRDAIFNAVSDFFDGAANDLS